MGKKLGNLIRSARTNAGFTQEQLARKVKGVTQADIGRYERGEAEPTTQTVKEIAKACGVTQKSLLDAMPKTTARTGTSSAKPSSSSKPGTSSSSSKTSMQLTATEKRLVELYRAADADTRKKALALLRGDSSDSNDILSTIGNLLGDKSDSGDILAGIGNLVGDLLLKPQDSKTKSIPNAEAGKQEGE